MSYFSADYLRPKYFAAHYFGSTGEPEETARSGYWRLNLYKLQEESLRKDKEKREEVVAKAVAKVIKPSTKAAPKPAPKVEVTKPYESKLPPAKPKYSAPPPQDNLPQLLEVWAIIQLTTIQLGITKLDIQRLSSAVEEAANDEEDIELLLLVA